MNNALIISQAEKTNSALTGILQAASIANITTLKNAGEARRFLIEKDFDLCIVNTPLPDEFGETLARHIASQGVSQVILLVRAEILDEITEKVEDYGVITLGKPISKELFWHALKLTRATHRKITAVQKENQKLIQKIEDIRIIDRAKCILVAHLAMSEPEAHRHIEKQAMDMRMTRREVAQDILKTYDNSY